MNKILVTITGKPRTGKDSLITATRNQLMGWTDAPTTVHLSSIEPIRSFLHTSLGDVGAKFDRREPTETDRQAMAEIKAVLDRRYDWTVNLAMQEFTRAGEDRQSDYVVFYQVREPGNLIGLRAAAEARGIKMIAVYVSRQDRPITGMAYTDGVDLADYRFDERIETGRSNANLTIERHYDALGSWLASTVMGVRLAPIS